MKEFLSKIGHVFRVVGTKAAGILKSLVGDDAAQQFADAALHLLKTEAGALALDAVEAVAELKLTSSADARAEAFAKLGTALKEKGVSIPESLANMLIEVAVNAFKGRLADINVS